MLKQKRVECRIGNKVDFVTVAVVCCVCMREGKRGREEEVDGFE